MKTASFKWLCSFLFLVNANSLSQTVIQADCSSNHILQEIQKYQQGYTLKVATFTWREMDYLLTNNNAFQVRFMQSQNYKCHEEAI